MGGWFGGLSDWVVEGRKVERQRGNSGGTWDKTCKEEQESRTIQMLILKTGT